MRTPPTGVSTAICANEVTGVNTAAAAMAAAEIRRVFMRLLRLWCLPPNGEVACEFPRTSRLLSALDIELRAETCLRSPNPYFTAHEPLSKRRSFVRPWRPAHPRA